MNRDVDSFPTAGLISWFSQALYSPVISATNTHFNALDQLCTSQIDCMIWFALGGEMEKTFALPVKKAEARTSKITIVAGSDRVEEPAHWLQIILLRY